MNKVFKRTLVASLLASASLLAAAQSTPAPASPAAPAAHPHGPGMGGMEGMHGPMDPAKMKDMMAKRHAQRMAEFKTVLRITPAQEGAWTAFTAAMTPPDGMMGPHHSPEERAKMRDEFDKLSTPERLEKMRALRKDRQAKMDAAMDKRLAAVKTFYAQLSPEQQKVFDITHKRMAERRMGRMMRHHGEGGPMMHHG